MERIEELKNIEQHGIDYVDYVSHNSYIEGYNLEKIEEIIQKYELGNRDVLEDIYNFLMKAKYYEEAAAFAKKYGL